MEVYVGLTLLTPFINTTLKNLSTKGLFGFAAVLLFLSSLPRFTPWEIVPNFFIHLYPLSYYVLGALIRRTQPKIKPLYGILATLALCLLWGGITVLSTNGTLRDSVYWDFPEFPSVTVAVCMFIALYQIQLPKVPGKVLAFAATGSYGAYLLSHMLDAWCYNLAWTWRREGRFLLIFLCVTLPIYIVSIGMGIGLDRLTKWLLGWGQKLGVWVKKRFFKEASTVE